MKLRDADLYRIYQNWSKGCGPFCCFFRSTNFVSLKHYPDFVLQEVSYQEDENLSAIKNIVKMSNANSTLFIVDLPGSKSIKTAYLLQKKLSLQPVLLFNSPLHVNGLVGGEEYISALLSCGEEMASIATGGYAFILDYNRFGDYDEQDYRKYFNNQYELTDEDLPPLEMLKDLGYSELVYIYINQVKEDIDQYLLFLTEQGFSVNREKL